MSVHGTCVAIGDVGILIRGAPGSGKSDLALRLLDAGARLVADDQVELTPSGGQVVATAPASISARMEVRGVGIVRVPTIPSVALGLVVDLVGPGAVPRLPERRSWDYGGVSIPLIQLAPFEASAAAKVRLAVHALSCSNIAPP
jgi:serine kinase of HPr protein (carbohydrate metabolism regulator)